jgi:hypothetical protein
MSTETETTATPVTRTEPSANEPWGTEPSGTEPSGTRPAGTETARVPLPKEIGGAKGPEPTRYGDWEHKGRCTDF